MSLRVFVVSIVFFNQRFVGLSWTSKQCYLARDEVCRWEQCLRAYISWSMNWVQTNIKWWMVILGIWKFIYLHCGAMRDYWKLTANWGWGGGGLLECYRATGEQIDDDGSLRIRIKQRNEAWINIHQTTDFVKAFATEPGLRFISTSRSWHLVYIGKGLQKLKQHVVFDSCANSVNCAKSFKAGVSSVSLESIALNKA